MTLLSAQDWRKNVAPLLLSSCLTVLFVACLLSAMLFAQLPADEFTIIALPDTQFYSRPIHKSFPHRPTGSRNTLPTRNADAAVSGLGGRVPYMIAMGNHDYDRNNPSGRTSAANNFNTFFGPHRYASATWHRGNFPSSSNENFYGVVNVNGTNYLILVLEFAARDSALNWAARIISANQDKQITIVNHMFTYADNTRISQCDENSAASFGVGQDNNGEDMWWKLVRKYSNRY